MSKEIYTDDIDSIDDELVEKFFKSLDKRCAEMPPVDLDNLDTLQDCGDDF